MSSSLLFNLFKRKFSVASHIKKVFRNKMKLILSKSNKIIMNNYQAEWCHQFSESSWQPEWLVGIIDVCSSNSRTPWIISYLSDPKCIFYLCEAVNTDSGVVFLHLASLGVSHTGNTIQAGIFSQGQRDLFQSIGESTHSVLFHSGDGLTLFL